MEASSLVYSEDVHRPTDKHLHIQVCMYIVTPPTGFEEMREVESGSIDSEERILTGTRRPLHSDLRCTYTALLYSRGRCLPHLSVLLSVSVSFFFCPSRENLRMKVTRLLVPRPSDEIGFEEQEANREASRAGVLKLLDEVDPRLISANVELVNHLHDYVEQLVFILQYRRAMKEEEMKETTKKISQHILEEFKEFFSDKVYSPISSLSSIYLPTYLSVDRHLRLSRQSIGLGVYLYMWV